MHLEIDIHSFEGHADELAFRRMVHGALSLIIKRINEMDSKIQGLVTEVTNLKNTRDASNKAWDIMTGMLTDAKAQITALQAQVASGGLDADSVAALAQSISDIHDVATTLKSAVPANTDQSGGGTPGQ